MLLISVCPARARTLARRPKNPEPRRTAANFTGFFDLGSCDIIAGWAADLNNLNTPIHVSVYDGPTLLTTILANISRPDVATFIGDNGLHGFNIPTPSVLKNGLPHSVDVRFESTTIQLGTSPRSITCATTPRDNTGTRFPLDLNFTINNGAASTQSRLVSPTFTAKDRTGVVVRDVTADVTHYRIREVLDSKPTVVVPGPRPVPPATESWPWIPLEHALILELALRNGFGKRYGERRIEFQVKTASLTSDVATDTIRLEPVLKEYRVSPSGGTHPLIVYAASQGFEFPLDSYQTCKGSCPNGDFKADFDLSTGNAAIATQGLAQGGGTDLGILIICKILTLGLLSCEQQDAPHATGTCSTKADYLLFEGRSPNPFWRIKSVASNAYVAPHGANRYRLKFSFDNSGNTCLPPSGISIIDVVVEGPEVDDFVDPANPWKNAFVRP